MVMNMREELGTWYPVLGKLFHDANGTRLGTRLGVDEHRLEPKLPNVFRALREVAPKETRVVIIGQDPYPGGHADGLAFSSGIPHIPYSLQMIFKSLSQMAITRTRGDLEDWAKQGVLLLNRCLSTVYGQVDAHREAGWDRITDKILTELYNLFSTGDCKDQPLVIIAWGQAAQYAAQYAGLGRSADNILYLKGYHPASTRRGFIFRGGEHLFTANQFLEEHGAKPIKWGD